MECHDAAACGELVIPPFVGHVLDFGMCLGRKSDVYPFPPFQHFTVFSPIMIQRQTRELVDENPNEITARAENLALHTRII
ncbi:MAG: hypothetical protein R3E89_00340 [Thiolinea sp.]